MNSSDSESLTVEDISILFDKVQARCFEFQDGIAPSSPATGYLQTISDLNRIQHAIIQHSLFSINEDLEEIVTENLKYLLVPYYMGLASSKISQDRLKNIEFAQMYLGEYLKLTNHYELVSKDVKRQWKNLSDEGNVNVSRDEKIAQYKENKLLQDKLNNLADVKEESERREAVLTEIKICILTSIDILRQNLEEIQILEYKKLIDSDPKAKEIHDKLNDKPLPRPTMTQITVFTPGITMPTVTLDEFADIAVEEMRQGEESAKLAKKRQEEIDELDSDRDSVGDPKQDEARRWDDWKDDNEKGVGNRFGK